MAIVLKNKEQLRTDILSAVLGIALALVTLMIGASLTGLTGISISYTPKYLAELFVLSLMLSMVAGYYFGLSLNKNESNAYLLAAYFSVTLFALVYKLFSVFEYFVVGPFLVVIFGLAIYNNNINLNKVSGKAFEAVSKVSLSVVSGGLNSLIIIPFLTPIIGNLSYGTWAWVLIVVVILALKYIPRNGGQYYGQGA